MEMLTILHNCVRDLNLQRFYLGNCINWTQLLTSWIQCSHSTLRMQARFVLGYIRQGLTEDSLHLLTLDTNDCKIFLRMFEECCQPPHFVTSMMGTMASVLEQIRHLVKPATPDTPASLPSESDVLSRALQTLQYPLHELSVTKNEIVAAIDTSEDSYVFSAPEIMKALENLLSTETNLKTFHSFDFLPHIKAILSQGGIEEKIAACNLLWSLACLDSSSALRDELRDQESTLSIALKQLQSQEDHELQLLSKCVTIKVHGGDEGEQT